MSNMSKAGKELIVKHLNIIMFRPTSYTGLERLNKCKLNILLYITSNNYGETSYFSLDTLYKMPVPIHEVLFNSLPPGVVC